MGRYSTSCHNLKPTVNKVRHQIRSLFSGEWVKDRSVISHMDDHQLINCCKLGKYCESVEAQKEPIAHEMAHLVSLDKSGRWLNCRYVLIGSFEVWDIDLQRKDGSYSRIRYFDYVGEMISYAQ